MPTWSRPLLRPSNTDNGLASDRGAKKKSDPRTHTKQYEPETRVSYRFVWFGGSLFLPVTR